MIRKRKDHLKQGRDEDAKLGFSGYSHELFMRAFTMFWVRWVIIGGTRYPIGGPQETADDKMIKVIRDCTDRHCFISNAHVNQPDTGKKGNVRLGIGA